VVEQAEKEPEATTAQSKIADRYARQDWQHVCECKSIRMAREDDHATEQSVIERQSEAREETTT